MDWVLSIVALAALVLLGSALWLWRRQGPSRQVWLMLLLAAVMIVNLAIWTVPLESGEAPLDRAAGR